VMGTAGGNLRACAAMYGLARHHVRLRLRRITEGVYCQAPYQLPINVVKRLLMQRAVRFCNVGCLPSGASRLHAVHFKNRIFTSFFFIP